ncbi:MAG: NAD(P)/FAD-dependent oxidoreductase [Parasporobacterium sp.]|nr:NAD(P)/FAD-dependent oxidoreductase [Parasporobacterium sp.]
MAKYDLIIIGGGPAGYAATVSALEAGMKVAVIEKERIGGVCVNFGCIPTKALLRFAALKKEGQDISYKDAVKQAERIADERSRSVIKLLESLGGRIISGKAVKVETGKVTVDSGEVIEGTNILIATGSAARKLPIAEYDDTHIITSKEALEMDSVPGNAVVVGTGATGIELATVWSRFGSSVTVLEMLPNIMGFDDSEISSEAVNAYEEQGIIIKTEVTVTEVKKAGEKVSVKYTDAAGQHEIITDRVLVAAGIIPVTEGMGLEELGMDIQRGSIQIDNNMRTNIEGIYAAGDVTGKMALAYVSSKQGKNAVAAMLGKPCDPIDYMMTPRCIFSAIEGSFVGPTEKQAKAMGLNVVAKKVPVVSFNGNYVGNISGIAKIVADAGSNKALGISIMGPDAADYIAAPALMISNGSGLSEVADVIRSGR